MVFNIQVLKNTSLTKLFKSKVAMFRCIRSVHYNHIQFRSYPCTSNLQILLRPQRLRYMIYNDNGHGHFLVSRKYHVMSLKDAGVKNYIKRLSLEGNDLHVKNPELFKIVQKIEEKHEELLELENMAKDDPELKEIAAKDALVIDQSMKDLEKEFFEHVIEPEPFDHNDVVIEVSAGVGGQEAMLFAQDLFQMYEKYANYLGLEFVITKYESTEIGGVRQGGATVSGRGAFSKLKFEGGVHRVQRVPKTEKAGRIHTSTATVAVLPLPTEIQVNIKPQDLKYEPKKASGAGGQHVNTTESAIRLTHIPSGTVVECQMDRSQIRNRETALQMLRAKIYQKELESQTSQFRNARKLQVGLGGRSEKIRTYNFVQDRVTDHRVGLSFFNLKGILDGGVYLNDLLAKLREFDHNERMSQLFS